MKHRIFWPIIGGLGLVLLILVFNPGSAQRPPDDDPRPGPPPGGPHPGRYVVAHATADRVVILDTATGQVYVARERDFKSMADLPRGGSERGFGPAFRERGDKDKEARRPLRDRLRPREKEKDGREDKDKDKDK